MDSVIQPLNNRGQETTEGVLQIGEKIKQDGCHGKYISLKKSLSAVFLWRKIIEPYSYEDLLVVIKNRYPNLKVCSLRTVKMFCSYHGIKKRMSVADGTVDIAVLGEISEVKPA